MRIKRPMIQLRKRRSRSKFLESVLLIFIRSKATLWQLVKRV